MRGTRVQIMEIRIVIEILPAFAADYNSYRFNFASLEWLGVPTLREIRIWLDFDNNARAHTHRRWPAELQQ